MTHEKNSAGFYKLANRIELAEGQMLQVSLEDEGIFVEVALTLVGGKLYAFRDVCPHATFPLSVGRLCGTKLECAGHGWEFDLTTGVALYPPVRKKLVLYETQQEGDEIWVKVAPLF